MTGVIAKSSNIGTVLAAREMRERPYHRYLQAFGLGTRTGLGVDGESAGVLPGLSDWGTLTKDTIAFGQGVAVSAVQMAAAVNVDRQRRRLRAAEHGQGHRHHLRRRRSSVPTPRPGTASSAGAPPGPPPT